MVIKSRRMRWAGNVTNVGKIGACRVLIGRWDGKKNYMKNLRVSGRILLKRI
jgi:hypothetical protein